MTDKITERDLARIGADWARLCPHPTTEAMLEARTTILALVAALREAWGALADGKALVPAHRYTCPAATESGQCDCDLGAWHRRAARIVEEAKG